MRYAPLFILSVKVESPNRCRGAEKYLIMDNDAELSSAEILRRCRCQAQLLQKEVAEQVGITRSVYMNMEDDIVDYWPKETVDKLAVLFHVMPLDLLTGYQLFVYTGQGQNIENMRRAMGMAKRAFARYLGVNRSLLQKWILGKTRISKKTWEKYFRQTG